MSASEGGQDTHSGKPKRAARNANHPVIMTFDYSSGQNILHTVDGSDPTDRIAKNKVQVLTALNLCQSTIPNRDDLQEVVHVEFSDR